MKFICLLVAMFYPTISWASPENIAVTQLNEEAFILKSIDYGTNIGLFKTTAGIVLIDPMPGDINLDALNALLHQLVGGTAKFIFNTHAHADHAGGNAYFIAKGAVLMQDAAQFTEIADVVVTSHSSMDKVFFHKKSNSIFVGDIYDTSWHPTFYAGGIAGFNHAIEAVLKLGNDNSLIVPGHGKATGKTELRLYQQHTLAWVARVRQLKNEGMTAHDIKNDAQIKLILASFNLENKADLFPEKALVRFIERTFAVIEQGE
jgi:glyoxylase-like metal-dependent hydrolase (beta-lactamase superfamily II)